MAKPPLYIVKVKRVTSKLGNNIIHYKFLTLNYTRTGLKALTKAELANLNIRSFPSGIVTVRYAGSHYDYFKTRITNYRIIMEE